MIRRHKTTIFTDAKESTTVYELKRIVEGILKRTPEDQRLYKVRLELRGFDYQIPQKWTHLTFNLKVHLSTQCLSCPSGSNIFSGSAF